MATMGKRYGTRRRENKDRITNHWRNERKRKIVNSLIRFSLAVIVIVVASVVALSMQGCGGGGAVKKPVHAQPQVFKFDKCVPNATGGFECACDHVVWETDAQRGTVAHCVAKEEAKPVSESTRKSDGQIAYESYQSFTGELMPKWEDQPEMVREAWEVVGLSLSSGKRYDLAGNQKYAEEDGA